MLNEKTQQRMLAYTARVGAITPIAGADNIELISVLGWKCIAKKGEFHEGDMCVYFEIDSKVPAADWSAFLEAKRYKIKTMKLSKFGVISQGLALPIDAFGVDIPKEEYADCTALLGVTYAVAEDNQRKAANVDPKAKYVSMKARHPKVFKTRFAKWMMKREWGRRIMFALFGKKKDKGTSFPNHFPYIHISDEERCENIPDILTDKSEWVKTTKIDGTSSLYILERKKFKQFEFYVVSRRVRQLTPSQPCYHEDNVYWQVAEKYHIKDCLMTLLKEHPEWSYVAIQGETAGVSNNGAKIQGDPHHFGELRFFGYNFITSDVGHWETPKAAAFLKDFGIPWVPIIDEHYILPDDMKEFKASADGPCEAEGASGLREGYVYRRAHFKDGCINSFKNVSVKYLLKDRK